MHPFAYNLLWQASLAPMCDDVPAGGFGVLVTTDETARRLRLAKQTLARWRVEGKGPRFVRLGGKILYPSPNVDAFVSGSEFSSTAEADLAAA
jgi:hypothetical protein